MERSAGCYHLGVAALHSSGRCRQGGSAGKWQTLLFLRGPRSCHTWTAVGRAFEVGPTSPRGVEMWLLLYIQQRAERDECLEPSVGEHSVRQVRSCWRSVASAGQPLQKRLMESRVYCCVFFTFNRVAEVLPLRSGVIQEG